MLEKKLNTLLKIKNNGAFESLNPKAQRKIKHQIKCVKFQMRLNALHKDVEEIEIPALSDGWDKFLPSDEEMNEVFWSEERSQEYGVHW